MNKTQALIALRKLIGPNLGVRENPKALVANDRPSLEDVQRASRLKEQADAQRTARRDELLANDFEYQELKVAAQRMAKLHQDQMAEFYGRRITVGISGALFFSVKAEGDNWAEVVAKVKAAKGAK